MFAILSVLFAASLMTQNLATCQEHDQNDDDDLHKNQQAANSRRATAFELQFGQLMDDRQLHQFRFYKQCHVFHYGDNICTKCCNFFEPNAISQPLFANKYCGCVRLDEAARQAALSGISRAQFEGSAAVAGALRGCSSLKFNTSQCNECCNHQWMEPYKGLIGNGCKCAPLQVVEVAKDDEEGFEDETFVLQRPGLLGRF